MKSIVLLVLEFAFLLLALYPLRPHGIDRTAPAATSADIAEEIAEELQEDAHGLLAEIGTSVNERIGWLRPGTVKERALLWVGLAIALPWALFSILGPVLKRGYLIVQLVCVLMAASAATWLGWRFWGEMVGVEQFASTLIVTGPVLLIHYHLVAAGMADERTNALPQNG